MKKTLCPHLSFVTPGEMDRAPSIRLFLTVLIALFAVTAQASSASPIRVGTSGDYAPFSVLDPAGTNPHYRGLAPRLARAFARDRGVEIQFVPFRWPDLMKDLEAGRFDVAMSGVTVRPERSLHGRFTLPITTSGALVLIPEASPFVALEDLDQNDFKIAVNAGGHLERVSRKHFNKARILPLSENERVIEALAQGDVDAAITDTREASVWQGQYPGLRRIGPFTRDRKAFLVRADNPELARDLDAWLIEIERNGRLEALRVQELGEPLETSSPTEPLHALLAAVDERLSLMPWVAEAKRATGAPIEVPEVEVRVLAQAMDRYRTALAEDATGVKRPEAAVLDFYRAQIDAAKSVQRKTLSRPAPETKKAPDLTSELRPALARINDRIATLLVALPEGLNPEDVREATQQEWISTVLPAPARSDITRALMALTSPKAEPESQPQSP